MEYDPKSKSFETSLGRSTEDGFTRKFPTAQTRRRRIEKMLKNEFCTVDEMRETFVRLKALALGGVQTIEERDGTTVCVIDAKPQFMQMWLDRLIGPVRNDEQIEREVEKRLAEMLELAEKESRRRQDMVDVKIVEKKEP